MSAEETPAASADNEREQLPPMPPLSANSPETRAYWDSLHKDLAELELRDALGGIRAIIAERLRMARDGGRTHPAGTNLVGEVESDVIAGDHAQAAALLAAEIDRQAGPRP